MAPETLLLGALLFVAVVAGWLLGRRQRSTPSHRSASAPVDYYRGLDHLLRDESDEAVSVLQGMAEADPGVVEIHFALATLFRRRGETDRAIRVHQDLLSRPRLSNRHRAQALLDLAEDYLKAGLFDRAEALFRQLAEQNIYRAKALRRLIDVYERQRDWQQAAETRVKLAAIEAGEHDPIIAQYYCEQAAEALQRQDLN
ncbi:MAG: tetratricopeptide repeat protein, partial [Gammaproteobacteria bacterium]|nr:tetratricopeptide repeat protein [Gammaproteobacteria bacterium]